MELLAGAAVVTLLIAMLLLPALGQARDMAFTYGLKDGSQQKAVSYLKANAKDAREYWCPMAEGNTSLACTEIANPT